VIETGLGNLINRHVLAGHPFIPNISFTSLSFGQSVLMNSVTIK
jgi:hypothetical protein